MDKIKPIAPSLLEKIRKLAFPDLLSEISLRLAIAKNLFMIACVLYYFLYLSIVGGLLGTDMGRLLVSWIRSFGVCDILHYLYFGGLWTRHLF